jgi:Mrp family chromosome partitioning ATPase
MSQDRNSDSYSTDKMRALRAAAKRMEPSVVAETATIVSEMPVSASVASKEEVFPPSVDVPKLSVEQKSGQSVGSSVGNGIVNVVPETSLSRSLVSTGGGTLPRSVDTPSPTMYLSTVPSAKKPKQLRQALRTRCKQLGVSVFLQGNRPVRSLGFTSAIAGEGKTFLARLTAEAMVEDSGVPVTLLECDWENPTLSSAYDLPPGPGLSEWLHGRCSLEAIRRPVANGLTVIPAGDSISNTTQLLKTFRQRGAESVLVDPDELLIIDLPATVTTAYGPFAAQLADALLLVIRMGVTPEPFVAEACQYLKDLPVEGVIFNQVTSRIPRWLRRIL